MEEDDREAPPPANVDDDMNEDADAPPAAEAEATDKKESKSQRALDLLYNPMKSDHDKSLWQFFTNQVAKLPTVDDLAKERELAGREGKALQTRPEHTRVCAAVAIEGDVNR